MNSITTICNCLHNVLQSPLAHSSHSINVLLLGQIWKLTGKKCELVRMDLLQRNVMNSVKNQKGAVPIQSTPEEDRNTFCR